MGTVIDKYSLDRLQKKGLEITFKCPYCRSARLFMKQRDELDYWNGVVCPKCGSQVVLDSLSLVVMRKNGLSSNGTKPEESPAPESVTT